MSMTPIAAFTFEVTQPPGNRPPVAAGWCTNIADAMREAGHYHRMYAQDGRARVEVYQEIGCGKRVLHLMATAGKEPRP
jgi:hypothetical protein